MQATEVTPPASAAVGPGGDRLVLLVARLAEVDVDVDQARADDQAAGVDDDLGLLVPLADGQDAPLAQPEVGDLVDVLAGVDDPAALDLDRPHVGSLRRQATGTGVGRPRPLGSSLPLKR